MAKEQFNVYLPADVIAMVRQLAVTEHGELSNSAVVESAIRKAHTNAQPQKRVEARRDGKKTVGWDMFYGDFHVGYVDGVANKMQAQSQLDSWVREELGK